MVIKAEQLIGYTIVKVERVYREDQELIVLTIERLGDDRSRSELTVFSDEEQNRAGALYWNAELVD